MYSIYHRRRAEVRQPNTRPTMSLLRRLILASTLVLTVGCSDQGEFDLRMSNADEHYVSDVAGELDAAGIDFRALRDGSIAYRSRDEPAFRSIEERLKKDRAASVYAKFESEEHKKQFIALLDAGRKRYRVERKIDGEGVRWYPSSDEEARDLAARALKNATAARGGAEK